MITADTVPGTPVITLLVAALIAVVAYGAARIVVDTSKLAWARRRAGSATLEPLLRQGLAGALLFAGASGILVGGLPW